MTSKLKCPEHIADVSKMISESKNVQNNEKVGRKIANNKIQAK